MLFQLLNSNVWLDVHGCPARPITRLFRFIIKKPLSKSDGQSIKPLRKQPFYLKRSEFSIYWMVASIIILLSITERDGLPYNIRWHSSLGSKFSASLFNIWESWPRKSLRNSLKSGQCRKKCSLSSLAMPQLQNGLRQSKLWRNLCSLRELNSTRHLVNNRIPCKLAMP